MSGDITVIEGDIFGAKTMFESVLSDKKIKFQREAEFAIQVLSGNDYALKVALGARQSVVNAVCNLASIGISLNPARKQAYLVPRKNKICLDISYIGLMDLAMESGSIMWGQARLVHENDQFEMGRLDEQPTHKFKPFADILERGPVIGAYVTVKTRDGDYLTDCMSTGEINAIRDRSEAWKAHVKDRTKINPWVSDWGEMAKKTIVKRASKYWPKTDRLDHAIHHLNTDGEEGLHDLAPQEPQPKAKPTMTDERLPKAIASIADGKYSYAQLIENFALTDEQLLRVKTELNILDDEGVAQ